MQLDPAQMEGVYRKLQRYPVMWQGLLALKNARAAVQMYYLDGNSNIARASLPPAIDGENATLRISQRMRINEAQLAGVANKLQFIDEHCVLVLLPHGKDPNDVVEQSNSLQMDIINYLLNKGAAGIASTPAPGSTRPSFLVHIFPSSEFTEAQLSKISSGLPRAVNDVSHLLIVITTI